MGPASCLSNSASKLIEAAGDAVGLAEPKTKKAETGEALEGLPGSESVARLEEDTRNWGSPGGSRRTNCEFQAGKELQRQEEETEGFPGIGSACSSSPQAGSKRPEVNQGADTSTKSAQATSTVGMIYERDFLECSYGYRPGRSPHQAVRALTDELHWGKYNFIVEADIKGYFEHIDHEKLVGMLEGRINDGALMGLIRKWLRAGILEEDGKGIHPVSGTPQGGVISPVLANVYLHHVLDQWFEDQVRGRNRGGSELFRYADDFVACFEYRHEAAAFEEALRKRLAEYGLRVAEEKTKTLRFGRNGGPHNGRFDFLGFEFYWEKDRKGRPTVKRRTAKKKWQAGLHRVKEWIQKNRSQPVKKLMKTLRAKLRGTWNYYGIIGNSRRMAQFYYQSNLTVFKWLNRRSQKRSYSWKAYNRLLKRFEIPPPRIVEKPRGQMPCQLEWSLCQRIAPFLKRVSAKVTHARAS